MSGELTLVVDYVAQHPDEVARHLDLQDVEEAAALLLALPSDAAAGLLARMAPSTAVRCLAHAPRATAAEWLEALPIDAAASLLRRLPPDDATPLVEELPSGRRAAIAQLLSHAPETAGGVMDPLVLVVAEAATAADVRTLIATQPEHLYYYLYVVDAAGRLTGVFDLTELMRADASTQVRDLMTPHVTWIPAAASLETVFAHPGWRDLDALPVVDGGRFVGLIRHRRMRQLRALRGEADEATNGVRTVMALGELYWLGLCGLVQGFGTAAASPGAGPGGER